MTLLSVAQDVCDLVGIPRMASIGTTSDTTYTPLRAMIQQAADDLFERHDWRALVSFRQFTTVGGQQQPGAMPPDYARMAQGHTMWNLTRDEEVAGPLDPATWTAMQRQGGTYLGGYWRFIGADIWLYPVPAGGHTIQFEYLTQNTIVGPDGKGKARWSDDRDFSILPEALIVLGAVWRWKSSKGFTYAEDLSNYERQLERLAANDAATPAIVITDDLTPWDVNLGDTPRRTGPINAGAINIRASNG